MRSVVMLVATLLFSLPAFGSELWLHIRSENRDFRSNRVVINLPVKVLAKALPLIPRDVSRNCELRINESSISPRELRAVVEQLRVAPSGTEVRVRPDGRELHVRKDGDVLEISGYSSWNGGMDGSVRVPFDLAEALLGGEGDLDFRAAVELLVRRGTGEIMLVSGEDQTVRIWVDPFASAPLRNGRVAP